MLLKMPVEGDKTIYVNTENLMVVAAREVDEQTLLVVFHFSNDKSFSYKLTGMKLSELEEALAHTTLIYDVVQKTFITPPEITPLPEFSFPSLPETPLDFPLPDEGTESLAETGEPEEPPTTEPPSVSSDEEPFFLSSSETQDTQH
jgi:hypothetical protein